MSLLEVVLVAAVVLGPQALWGQCAPEEQVFAACRIAERQTQVSVCYTADTATYRYGPIARIPDLVLSVPMADLAFQPWSGLGRDIWESTGFDNKGYRYVSG